MIKKFPWLMFVLVFGWKVALFFFTSQPVPANDAFFYDGAVIHKILHGGYFNPSLAQALPISGTQLYSTYPPLYQAVLLGWLKVAGVSALTVMALHLVLFGIYSLVLYLLLRQLKLPSLCINLAGAFLLSMTFHDRPDSLAHCLGIAAIYFWARFWEAARAGKTDSVSGWMMALCSVLTLCTSLQIGGIYFAVIVCANGLGLILNGLRPPPGPLLALFLAPIGLVLLVKCSLPLAWAGFLEHARQTPSFTGLRFPHIQEAAKIIRTVPGVLLVAVLMLVSFVTRLRAATVIIRPHHTLLLAAMLGAIVVIGLSSFILTANTIAIAGYLQPLIVGVYLGLLPGEGIGKRQVRLLYACFISAALLVSIRALGMTTWGSICAKDVNYRQSAELVNHAIAGQPAGSKVVMSSAFLYDSARRQNIEMIHSDWLARAGGDSRVTDVNALIALKPGEMILTQFDYYRRFEKVLGKLQETPGLVQIQITNTAQVRAPDSYKSFQQVVQNISWAPVIVTFSWSGEHFKRP